MVTEQVGRTEVVVAGDDRTSGPVGSATLLDRSMPGIVELQEALPSRVKPTGSLTPSSRSCP